ncbi:MAG: hypothetical protein ACOCYX_06795 [Spirochaetota bacterium]
MTIPSEFRELFALFNSHRVEYAVVGGYAVAFHGVDLLRANKRSTGRAKDQADLESLGSGE